MLILNGCPERNATQDAGQLGRLQMVNHSCAPNCKIESIPTVPGLELYVLEALDDIPVDDEPLINYDACATVTEKTEGTTFWQWSPIPRGAPKGGQRWIQCLCAGSAGMCPNRLWRRQTGEMNVSPNVW